MTGLGLARWRRSRPVTFRHGTHPDAHKETTHGLPIEHMPLVREYVLPLSQHGGAPSRPCVQEGQRVRRGECLAEPHGFRSAALHAPAAGIVRGVELRPHPAGGLSPAVVLRTDFYADQRVLPFEACSLDDPRALLRGIQRAGVVGLGGAAYPAHAKLRVPEGKRVDVVVLNGAECEPYLTSDHRVMVERSHAVVAGMSILMTLVGAAHGRIGVEVNKPDAIDALERACAASPELAGRVRIVPLQVKYPEGAKQMLIEAVTGVRVPLGGRSIDTHVTIHNVATSAAIFDACTGGMPLVERVVTVTGPGIRRPANLCVPIGTPVSAVLEHCDGLTPDARAVVLGGAMMGQAQASLDAPVIKGTTGVLVLTGEARTPAEDPCIRCGRCLDACAMFLNPTELATLTRAGDADALRERNVGACFECGSCTFVCPSRIPLTELIRIGKGLARRKPS